MNKPGFFSRFCAMFLIVSFGLPFEPSTSPRPAIAAGLSDSGNFAASTYLVNSTQDTPDADPADGICADADGKCTLRAAIMQANFSPDADTILLPPGIFQLSRAGNDDNALVGDLDILADLTIQGAGPEQTIVDGNGSVTGDRVFQVLDSAKNVSLSDLTIRNGAAPSSGLSELLGGGIYMSGSSNQTSAPSLQLQDVIIEGNTAENGGGLYAIYGKITLIHSLIRSNIATNLGGGLYAGVTQLTIQDSQAYENSANIGGAFALSETSDGLIQRTEIYSNTVTGYGGGISNSSSNANPYSLVTLQDSSLHNNHADYNGGAIDDYSALVLSHTVLDKNSAGTYGGGLMIYQTYVPSTIEISQSTLSANTAQFGGGIFYNDFVGNPSKMMVQNSTLSGNVASHQGGGIYAIGQARLTLLNATIASNEAYRRIPQHYASFGGGLVITSTAVITAQNTLIGDNIFTNGITLPTPDDCYGSLLSLGNNLIQTTTNCSIYGTTYGNVTGQDPLLDPLQNDGGLTPTRPLQASSPAIDAGSNSACPPDDQRGVTRPYDGNGDTNAVCDIGAYEFATQLSQSIQFGAIADKSLLDPPFVITATASSGLPVDLSTDSPSICDLSDSYWFAGVSSATVHLSQEGRCILVAQQPGNATFTPAASQSQSFDVSAAPEGTNHLFLPLLEKK